MSVLSNLPFDEIEALIVVLELFENFIPFQVSKYQSIKLSTVGFPPDTPLFHIYYGIDTTAGIDLNLLEIAVGNPTEKRAQYSWHRTHICKMAPPVELEPRIESPLSGA